MSSKIWSMSEDLQLCISYCRQSVDPISGNKQKIDKLWKKIDADFHESWILDGNQPREEARSQTALSSRFNKLKPMLVYWSACLSYAERNRESGCNLQDELRKAQMMYVAKMKKEFMHFSCWEVVKTHQTFARTETSTPHTYTYEDNPQIDEELVNDISSDVGVEDITLSTLERCVGGPSSPVRPPGVKAAKEAKRKGKLIKSKSSQHRDIIMETMAQNQKDYMDWQKTRAVEAHRIQKEANNIRQLEEDTKIMQMNTDMMTPNSKSYFTKRKAAAIRRYDSNETGNSFASNSDCYRPSNYDD